MTRIRLFLLSTALYLLAFSAAHAGPRQDMLSGPIPAELVSVYDGDTVTGRAHAWIGQEVETSVRLDGIDAPEIKGKCAAERERAEEARQEVIRVLGSAPVYLTHVKLEKYAGRVLARLETADGVDISQHMIEKGFARAYSGHKRESWCGTAESGRLKKG